MTRSEFYAKYGDVVVTPDHYYKFTFSYRGTLENGDVIEVDYGGNSDQIYRFDVSVRDTIKVSQLEPYAGRVYREGNEVESESFYDYE
jgi:hypothetical protein